MKSTTIPIACAVALATMTTAALSHWWSVRQFVAAVHAGMPLAATHPHQPAAAISAPNPASPATPSATLAANHSSPARPSDQDGHQKDFYEALIRKIENLQNQNRDLIDQVASTNRDLMQLEFRVDTHSSQFRPLPVTEERLDTTFEDEPGVLPPRAEPVDLPTHE